MFSAADPLSSRRAQWRRNGEGGIRTLEAGIHPPNALAGRRLQPLGHFSGLARTAYRTFFSAPVANPPFAGRQPAAPAPIVGVPDVFLPLPALPLKPAAATLGGLTPFWRQARLSRR